MAGPPGPPPAFPRETLQLDFPGFPERTRKQPLPGSPHLLGDSACEHITQHLCAREGGPRQGTESLPAPSPGPDLLLHPPPRAEVRPQTPGPPSPAQSGGVERESLGPASPASRPGRASAPSQRLPERTAYPPYCAENGDRHLRGAGDAVGPHAESGATGPATGREMDERHCCLYD